MRYCVLALIMLGACTRAHATKPAIEGPAVETAECYALAYSDSRGGAIEKFFPTWVVLLPGDRAEATNLPDFLRRDANAYKGWRRLDADSLSVKFTSTAEGLDFQLARVDSNVVGRAIWLTDVIGGPEISMRVMGTRHNCPSGLLSRK